MSQGASTPPITVSEAGRILDLSADAVRRLERLGTLPSVRTSSGMRLFDRVDVERVAAERRERRSR